MQYMQLIYAAILGYFLFEEIPDGYTIAGAAVIIGASIFIFHRRPCQKETHQTNDTCEPMSAIPQL